MYIGSLLCTSQGFIIWDAHTGHTIHRWVNFDYVGSRYREEVDMYMGAVHLKLSIDHVHLIAQIHYRKNGLEFRAFNSSAGLEDREVGRDITRRSLSTRNMQIYCGDPSASLLSQR
jgi:hypothetical protein